MFTYDLKHNSINDLILILKQPFVTENIYVSIRNFLNIRKILKIFLARSKFYGHIAI